MTSFPNAGSGAMVRRVAAAVVANRAYLSEIDGKIGDGDHGNNMAKGFGRAAERISDDDTLDKAFATLTDVHFSASGDVVLMALLGGMGTTFGPIVGAAIIDTMQNYLAPFGAWVTVTQGAIFVLCVLAFRRGVIGEINHKFKMSL